MEIQLKNLKFYKQLSRETVCFQANVYIDGHKVGTAMNSGEGGETRLELSDYFNKNLRQLVNEADDYCKQLPDRVIKVPGHLNDPENDIKVKMDIIEYIDMLMDQAWYEKEKEKLLKWITRNQVDSIIFGNEDGDIFRLKLKHGHTIAELLQHKETGRELINNVKKKLKPGQKILNKNIPEEML